MILTLDTALQHISLALFTKDQCRHCITRPCPTGTGDVLITCLQELLQKAQIHTKDLSAVICGTGPGSFTGVRMALSCARAIGLAHNIPVKGLTALQGFGHFLGGAGTVLIDTKRDDFYAQDFDDKGNAITDPYILTPDVAGEKKLLTGEVAPCYQEKWSQFKPCPVSMAELIGTVAHHHPDELTDPVPLYVRGADVGRC